MKATQTPPTTQLDKANSILVDLSVNVTSADRKEAMETWSESTVVQYLLGRGKKLDIALELIKFFRNRIEEREKLLA